MERVLECPGRKDFRVLENPGIWSLLVLESPGKSILMKPVVCVYVCNQIRRLRRWP